MRGCGAGAEYHPLNHPSRAKILRYTRERRPDEEDIRRAGHLTEKAESNLRGVRTTWKVRNSCEGMAVGRRSKDGDGANIECKEHSGLADRSIAISQRTRFQVAMILAIAADALQLVLLPLFVEGAESPAEDILDLGVGAALFGLLGWHWEFLPSFLGKLVPGVDLAPFWTLAVANVYRKSKRTLVTANEGHEQPRS